MNRRALSLFALTGLALAAAVTPVAAQCCGCGHACKAPRRIQIWGVQPGFYTWPTYEGETLTVDYPAVGYSDPFDHGPYDPFRHQLYNPYWPHLPPEHGRFRGLHRRAATP